jgi:putative ABC transport system permease protein
MEILLQDLRYTLRILLKNPGFAAIAVFTLGLGIGANTAIFSVTNALFLRPLSVRNPEMMVRVYAQEPESEVQVVSYLNYTRMRDHSRIFAGLAAHQATPISFSTGANSDTINAEVVSGNYFQVFQMSPIQGRLITPEDDQEEGAHPVAVISHRLWNKYFQSSNDTVGRKIYLNSKVFEIIGIAPESFRGSYLTTDSDLWAPIAMHEVLRPRGVPLNNVGWGWLSLTGRMKKGTTLGVAGAELDQIASQLRKEFPGPNDGLQLRIASASSLPEELNHQLSKALRFLSVVTALVLLVVCANVAGALLPRILSRRREIAIRNSLGASRSRLMRQWFTECFVLCLLGGSTGMIVALWSKEGLKLILPPEWQTFIPIISIDAKVMGFALFATLLSTVLCGFAPILYLRKTEIQSGLKGETGGVPRYRLFGTFVCAQTGISLILLIVAALLLRSLNGSESFKLGFNEKNLLLASVDTRRHGYTDDRGRQFFQDLAERLKRIPMIQSVSYATVTPLDNGNESQGYRIPGHPKVISIDNNSVGPDYFRTLGIPLIGGRAFTDQDIRSNSNPVAIVNETMAKKFWPSENAIGKKFHLDEGSDLEIVGVVKDIQYYSVGEKPRPYVYICPNSVYVGQMTLQIRTTNKPEDLIPTLLKEIKSLDPNIAPFQVQSFTSLRKVQIFPIRALAIISTLIGFVALVLTALGIYGVVAYSVAQRTKEIGVRMALGSPVKRVLWMILSQGMKFVLLGAAMGILIALLTTRFLSTILFQISPNDFLSFAVMSGSLIITGLIAAFIPALRTLKIDPNITLRYE